MDRPSGPKVLLVVSLTLDDGCIEFIEACSLRQTMAEENTVGSPHRQGDDGKQLQIGGVNRGGSRPVGRIEPCTKQGVELGLALGNGLSCPLGQFMIAEQEMNLLRILAFERRQEVDQLVR